MHNTDQSAKTPIWTGPRYCILCKRVARESGSLYVVFGVAKCSPGCAPPHIYRIQGDACETITQEYISNLSFSSAAVRFRKDYPNWKEMPIFLCPELSRPTYEEEKWVRDDPAILHTTWRNWITHTIVNKQDETYCAVCGGDNETMLHHCQCPGIKWYSQLDEIPRTLASQKQLYERGLVPYGEPVAVYRSIKDPEELARGTEATCYFYSVAHSVSLR